MLSAQKDYSENYSVRMNVDEEAEPVVLPSYSSVPAKYTPNVIKSSNIRRRCIINDMTSSRVKHCQIQGLNRD